MGSVTLSFLQPFHSLPWQSWHSEIIVFVACTMAFFSMIATATTRTTSQIQVPVTALMPLCFGLIALIQGFAGQITFFGDVLVLLGYSIICAQAMVIGFHLSPQCDSIAQPSRKEAVVALPSQLAIAIVAAAAISVCISLTQVFDLAPSAMWLLNHDGYRRPGANLGQPNQFATLVLMGVVSLVFIREVNYIRPLTAFMVWLLLCIGLAISESRAGLLGATALAIWWSVKPIRVLPIAIVWGSWALLIAMFLFWPSFIDYVFQGGDAVFDSTIGIARTPSLRLRIWPQLIEASLIHPWVGWGLRGVSVAHNMVLGNYTQGEPYTYAHNLLLELIIGLGYPGGILIFISMCVWGLRRARQVSTPESQLCLALCIPFACHSLVEFPFAYAYFLLPVMLAVGMLEAYLLPQRVIATPVKWVQVLAALSIGTVFWTAYEYVQIEEDFRVARMEALRIGKTPTDYVAPNVHLLTQLDSMLRATRTNPAPEMRPEQIEMLRNAAMRFPWTAIQNRYALALALNGDPAEAARQLRVMRAMFGQRFYEGIRQSWIELATTKYPQLNEVEIP